MTTSKNVKGPNKYPDPRTDKQAAQLAVTCKYLGRTFYEGDKICYRGDEWLCTPAGWQETGAKCGPDK